MQRATEAVQGEAGDVQMPLHEWLAALVSLSAVGAAALAALGVAYWLVSHL